MKEALVNPDRAIQVIESPIPTPGKGEVLIKVAYAGTNPKDWKFNTLLNITSNTGDDMSGTVEQVGEGVLEFKPGDRVAALHQIGGPGGTWAEYALAPATTTFHLPENVAFPEGATVPLTAFTAALALYHNVKLPLPWQGNKTKIPLLIYGGSSAIGAFAIKLAARSNIHPLIVVAGRGRDFVEPLLDRSQGDTIVDYRASEAGIVSGIQGAVEAANAGPILHAFDATSNQSSLAVIAKAADPKAHVAVVVPWEDYTVLPQTMEISLTWVSVLHTGQLRLDLVGLPIPKGVNHIPEGDGLDFGLVFSRLVSKGLADGWLTPHPAEVIAGGLKGIETGLANLQAGKASAVKYIYDVTATA